MKRLRIAYLVPGHNLLPSAGPTRNVLSLAEALSELADVTVAFRRIADEPSSPPFEVHALEPGPPPADPVDDAAIRGTGVADLLAYTSALRTYAARQRFDVILEKSWLLSGYLAHVYRKRGVPGAVVETNVRVWSGGALGWDALRGWLRHRAVRAAVRRWLPRADGVIAETNALRRSLVRHLGVPSERVSVVGLGLDHVHFRPGNRAAAREQLGLSQDARVLLYFGVLDATHDLTATLTAVRDTAVTGLEVHVLGDGERRPLYERLVGDAPVHFHGRVPHAQMPAYIAASDLCLAPYAPEAFIDGEINYFTLKIPEAMACARPVATIPGEQTSALVEHGVSGFLVDNAPGAWGRLLAALPPREVLDGMGARAAERAAAITWRNTALGYLKVCQQLAR